VCGIAGAFGLNGVLNPLINAALPAMARALSHRGPDGEGFFSDRRAALAHRRLAIIDRASGAQPIANEDRTVWIVFNGEIYNHRALRSKLESRGHVFRTASDTEVIVHAYEEYGADCVQRLEGMFAFAIYDKQRRQLMLARDRVGKKPLYYAIFGDALHFGSEIKALRQSPAWDGTLDVSGLESYLSLGYYLAPRTAYRHVQSLEPGHVLQVRAGDVSVRKYWDLQRFDDEPLEGEDLYGHVEDAIRRAVRDRLEAEVPLGAFLSGGIDSGLVVSYMAEGATSDVLTTSVGFGDEGHNELAAAALTAQRWATTHRHELIAPRLDQVMTPILTAFDQPFADSSAIPTYYVSGAARRHVTVALSGDGGDESFTGYGFRYLPHAAECMVRKALPGQAGRAAARWLGRRWPRSRALPRALRWGTLLENLDRDPAAAYYADLCFLKPAETRRLLGLTTSDDEASPAYQAVTSVYRSCPSNDPVQCAEYADLKIYLPNDVLVKVDRMSMAHSLEVRCPLLDHRLIELAFRVPRSRKAPWLRSKHLLRRLARTRLPAEVVTLPKRGFTAPIGAWIAGPYRHEYRDEVFGSDAVSPTLVDTALVRRWFDEHCQGQRDHSYALWAIWMLERWARLQPSAKRGAGLEVLAS
jgi:asparagine synthase (glutamine-hydrolysing)